MYSIVSSTVIGLGSTLPMACARSFESTITGIINVSRSIFSATYLHTFRTEFRAAVLSRLRVHIGQPDPAHLARNRSILKWFMPKGSATTAQRTLLEMFARSDWEDEDRILIYVLPGAHQATTHPTPNMGIADQWSWTMDSSGASAKFESCVSQT